MAVWSNRFLGYLDLPRELSRAELDQFFKLDADAVEAISAFNRKFRVAVAVQLGFCRMSGRRLDRFKVLPRGLLVYLSEQLKVDAPSIATMRSMYQKRSNTLYEHQAWVQERLGLKYLHDKQEAMLLATLRTASHGTTDLNRLKQVAREWLADRKTLLPAESTLHDICVRASKDTEAFILEGFCKTVDELKRKALIDAMFSKRPNKRTVLEWLRQPPKRRRKKTLDELFEKIEYINALGIHEVDFPKVSIERLRSYARELRHRSPSRFDRLSENSKTLQTISFLRVVLAECSDAVIEMGVIKKSSDLWSTSSEKIRAHKAKQVQSYREALFAVFELKNDKSLTHDELVAKIDEIEKQFEGPFYPSHAAEVRGDVVGRTIQIRPLLRKLAKIGIQGDANDAASAGLQQLKDLYDKERTELPEGTYSVPRVWEKFVNDSDRAAAMRGLEAAVLFELRRGFRKGSCFVPNSDSYRDRDATFIPAVTWQRERSRHYSLLKLPHKASEYYRPIIKAIEEGLTRVARAIAAGEIDLRDGDLHIDRLMKEGEPAEVVAARALIDQEIGDVQLPDLLVEMDVKARFSTALLGRPPVSAHECLTIYSGLLGHASDMTAKHVAMMIPELKVSDVTTAMRALEFDNAVDETNTLVLDFMSKLPIVRTFGDGSAASSDMMSLTTSKHLWNARLDPRRREPSVGMYTHVRNLWDIVYHVPIVLGERQVGAAIEGVVRQHDHAIKRLAVDTHGYTDVGMGVAHMLGFDLCPQLANLPERRLSVPRGTKIPATLVGIVRDDLNLDHLEEQWDELVRVVASINNGTTSAIIALQRFGSAAQQDPVYKAARVLGRMVRTLFLCDFLTNAEFRREMRRLLNRGESVHVLQHAIHVGPIQDDRGRRKDELTTISACLTFMSNLVIAWNFSRMGEALDRLKAKGVIIAPEVVRHISPARFNSINFRGQFRFAIERFRDMLVTETAPFSVARAVRRQNLH
jgi:TnpA family transposase